MFYYDLRETVLTIVTIAVTIAILAFLLPISVTFGFKVAQQIGLVQCYSSQVDKK